MAKPSIIGHLQSTLRKTLKDKDIVIGEITPNTGNYGFVSCKGHIYHMDEENGHNIGLLPFRVSESIDYNLSILLTHHMRSIKHVSISVYDNEKVKLFRAEWATNDGEITHGQPHWHVHAIKSKANVSIWEPDAVTDFGDELGNVDEDYIKRIHFAMCASWHTKTGHNTALSDADDNGVLNWIDGALNYINEQLTYLSTKVNV